MRFSACLAAIVTATALPALAQNSFPDDVRLTCAIDEATFESWISGGTETDLEFGPPDGFAGRFDSDCAFYKWGAQMFLWLTSSADGSYVFDATGFFDVVHDAAGTEKVAKVEVLPNGNGAPNRFALRGAKPDFQGGAEQAGGGAVLLAQNGSLTYYGMHVNDTYVAFRNTYSAQGQEFNFVQGPDSSQQQFPSTLPEINHVVDFGQQRGIITANPDAARQAGTVELKTSWIETTNLPAGEFITITAQVHHFEPSKDDPDELWLNTGVQTKELALVGMHIAAPVSGHPELVWISYEHVANSPLGSYLYFGSGTDVQRHAFDSSGTWTFAQTGATWPKIILPKAKVNADGNIEATRGNRIEPQNVVQFNPWGLAADSKTNVTSNTDLVSLNASLTALLGADSKARDNYYQIGGVWTDGTLPVYQDYSIELGGLNLANSTMETFHQFGAQASEGGFIPRNCFDCHGVSGSDRYPQNNPGVSISHIFQGMQIYKP